MGQSGGIFINSYQKKSKRVVVKNHIIKINSDILRNVEEKNWVKTLKDFLKTKYSKGINVDDVNIKVTSQSRGELLNSSYTQWLKANDSDTYKNKMKMLDGLEEIYQNQRKQKLEDPNHPRKDGIISFKRGKADIEVGQNSYTADVLTGIRKNTGELVYDIVNIEKEEISIGETPRNDISSSRNNIS